MATPPFVPLTESSFYHWRASTKTPNLYIRPALGAEKKWACQASISRQLFLSGEFELAGPYANLSHEDFGRTVERAWLRVRYEFPAVVLRRSTSSQWDDGTILLEVEIPGSDGEAREWVRRSLFVGTCGHGEGAVEEDLRQDVVREPVCVRLNARLDLQGKVSGAEFAVRVDHLNADGVGAYIVTGRFLKFLADAVGGREEEYDWEAGKGKLPRPWVDIMNREQKTHGKEFEENVKNLAILVTRSSKSEWGLKLRCKYEYMPKAAHKRFSVEETDALLLAVKAKLGKTCTVTHLGHAAMVMTMLKSKPVDERPTHSTNIVSPLFINARKYLDQDVPEAQNYIPLCRAISAIEFRNVEDYILTDDASKEEVQEKLKLACAEAVRSYQAVRDQKSLLTESFHVAEYMAKAKNSTTILSSDGKADAKHFFLSDGLVEKYISNSCLGESKAHSVLEVEDVRFTANPDGPALIIRISTFRQAINLSAEWNEAYHTDGYVREFLDNVAELIMSFTRD